MHLKDMYPILYACLSVGIVVGQPNGMGAVSHTRSHEGGDDAKKEFEVQKGPKMGKSALMRKESNPAAVMQSQTVQAGNQLSGESLLCDACVSLYTNVHNIRAHTHK